MAGGNAGSWQEVAPTAADDSEPMTNVLRTAFGGSRALVYLTALMAALTLVTVVGPVADDRMLLGQPVWLKPFKFAVSFVVYGLSLAWLMAHLRRGKRVAKWSANVIAVTSVLEVGLITFQAARGRSSHFNTSSMLDEVVWRAMGATIVVLWLATAVIAVLVWRDGMPDRAGTWTVRLGMVLLLAGLLQGFFMVIPRPEQIALDEQGVDTLLGAHAVGVPDGGPGMPLTGWSTTGGDLRIGHFIGIHGLQAILLFGMLLSWLVTDAARRTRLVMVFAFAYAGLLTLVTWQALRGQPVTAPDSATVFAFAALAGATVLAGVISWVRPVRAG
ncbi:hypothetical protein Rhe02_45420 [Rhizocola hellebori]|uniref:Uncharacterized protein n=1 Tax=Rhizocola hellebori TaxID=1392758 RepID=A0A8J3VHG2_9ACTN|nr:hypothetical protein [Rhizocola hellebori]GIH06475.1 hypothetical protein Rhe02_45420 [Rhizocola hellebori]